MIDRLIAKILENPEKPARAMIYKARTYALVLIAFSLGFYAILVWLNFLGTSGKSFQAAWMTYLSLCLAAFSYLSIKSSLNFFNQTRTMLAGLPKNSKLKTKEDSISEIVAIDEFEKDEKDEMLDRLYLKLADVKSSLAPRVILNITFISPWLGPALMFISNSFVAFSSALLVLIYTGYSTRNRINSQIEQIKQSIDYLKLKC